MGGMPPGQLMPQQQLQLQYAQQQGMLPPGTAPHHQPPQAGGVPQQPPVVAHPQQQQQQQQQQQAPSPYGYGPPRTSAPAAWHRDQGVQGGQPTGGTWSAAAVQQAPQYHPQGGGGSPPGAVWGSPTAWGGGAGLGGAAAGPPAAALSPAASAWAGGNGGGPSAGTAASAGGPANGGPGVWGGVVGEGADGPAWNPQSAGNSPGAQGPTWGGANSNQGYKQTNAGPQTYAARAASGLQDGPGLGNQPSPQLGMPVPQMQPQQMWLPAPVPFHSGGWTEYIVKETGEKYYHNSRTQVTQWERPASWGGQ